MAGATQTHTAFNQACMSTAVINQDLFESTGVTVDAPDFVEAGEQFTFRIQQDASSFPDKQSGATTTNISRYKFDFMIPDNATYVDAEVVPGTGINLSGITPDVQRVNDAGTPDASGNILRLSGDNEVIANSPSSNTKKEGGIIAPKTKKNLDGTSNAAGESWFQLPAVDVTVQVDSGATGNIDVRLRTAGDAGKYNNDKNFSTFLPLANLLGKQWAPTRCVPAVENKGDAAGPGARALKTVRIYEPAAPEDVDTTTMISGPVGADPGDSLDFTAEVSPVPDSSPAGDVQFTIDGVDAGSPIAVDGDGLASITHTFNDSGDHTVRAVYLGSDGFRQSVSAVHVVHISGADQPGGGGGGGDVPMLGSLESLDSLNSMDAALGSLESLDSLDSLESAMPMVGSAAESLGDSLGG